MEWIKGTPKKERDVVEDLVRKSVDECLEIIKTNVNILSMVTKEGSPTGFTAMVTCQLLFSVMQSDTYQKHEQFSKLVDQMVMEVFNETRRGGGG